MLLSNLIGFVKKTQEEKGLKAFPWADGEMGQYLSWAFSKNYLFVSSSESEINGMLIAYPINWVFENKIENLLPQDADYTKEQEAEKQLCIMDGIFKTEKARLTITNQFKTRFPNWEKQTKWAVRDGKVRELTNKYINLTGSKL